jgi:hypothetical protein
MEPPMTTAILVITEETFNAKYGTISDDKPPVPSQ